MPAAAVSTPSSSTIHTYLNYHLSVAEGGTNVQYPGTAHDKFIKNDVKLVEITDVRGREDEFTLDRNGFQFFKHHGAEKMFDDDERVKGTGYDEISELLKRVTGASRVHPFSHIIRWQTWQASIDAAQKAVDKMAPLKMMVPAMGCHVDQSYTGALEVLHDNLSPSSASTLSQTRWAIINVWRPIGAPVQREPLAVCDAQTVADDYLRPVRAMLPQKGKGSFDNVSKGASFETFRLAASPRHRWYFQNEMGVGEGLLIKCFDSKRDGRARLSPHSAFCLPEQDETVPARQSIEVRCLVFWEDQGVV